MIPIKIGAQLTLTVFAAVLFSAFFQGGWNFFAKKSKADKVSLLAIGWLLNGVIVAPFYFLAPQPAFDSSWWPYLIGSGAVHAVYVLLLGWAYEIGEISVVYPISRGLGILGTTTVATIVGLQHLSVIGFLGIAFVVGGTLAIGWREIPLAERRKAFLASVLVAATVSTYSLIDSEGAKKVPLFLYILSMNIIAPLLAGPYLWIKSPEKVKATLKNHKLEALLVACAGMAAYAIVLWAYRFAPVAYVAALREFSVVIASLLGIFVLKEALYKRKAAGIALIVGGIVLLKTA